ncbi:MAG: energy transducer TonB [Thermodesulfobacteriota bacterium]|nr:energy transducer TonB [Thermodesulfobacteriota bacterium]
MVGITPLAEAPDSEWKIPISLAVGVHVLVFLAALIVPLIVNRQPRMPEVYTVNLFSATEISPAPATEQPRSPAEKKETPPAPPEIEPPKPKAKVSIPLTPEITSKPAVPMEKPQVVSLKPSKIKKMKKQKVVKDVLLSKALQRIHARAEEKKARQAADRAINDAVSQLRNVLRSENSRATGSAGGKTGEKPAVIDEILKRYYTAVYERVHTHWNLPDLQNWKDSLEAVVILEVRKDGIITSKFFEKKSDNHFFNQFVNKAIQEASPLPPFPLGLEKERLEIGLRFRPGELL